MTVTVHYEAGEYVAFDSETLAIGFHPESEAEARANLEAEQLLLYQRLLDLGADRLAPHMARILEVLRARYES